MERNKKLRFWGKMKFDIKMMIGCDLAEKKVCKQGRDVKLLSLKRLKHTLPTVFNSYISFYVICYIRFVICIIAYTNIM